MGNKIKLSDISEKIKEYIEAYDLGLKKVKVCANSTSSEQFERSTSLVLVEFLPVLIILSYKYYTLVGSNKISEIDMKKITSILSIIETQLSDNNATDAEKNYFIALQKKSILFNINRAQFEGRDFVQFDSKSGTHDNAFKGKIPKKNITLKIDGMGTGSPQIRIGIKIQKNEISFEIVNIVNKKNGNG